MRSHAMRTAILAPFVVSIPLAIATALLPDSAAADARLTRLLRHEVKILGKMNQLGSKVAEAEAQLDDLEHEQAQMAQQMADAHRRIAALETRADERQQHIRRRVRGLYKLSRGGLTRLVLESLEGHRDLARQIAATRLVLRRDTEELALYRREQERLDRAKNQLAKRRQAADQVQQRLAARRASLRASRKAQQQLLWRVRSSRSSQESLTYELSQRQERLKRRVARLRYKIVRSTDFAAQRGRLTPPVRGSVVGAFGLNLLVGSRELSILRHGVTFTTRRRAKVKAVASGTVRLSQAFDGYGQLVLLQHRGNYFTLYGYLSEIAVSAGERIGRGKILGRAGLDPLTGDWAVYFEIRRGERALDPAEWLR